MTWYDSDYGYKKKITIDNTKVAGDETDFPVLISVTDNDLRDEANGGHVKHANGYDIIFTNGAETVQLKHEIERYVNTSGLLVFWVKIPSLSSTADTDIYIYYGKAGVGADPSTTDTWDANYKLVCHLDDPDTGTNVDDSTANGNDGTKKANAEPTRITGKIGYGQDFDGTDDDIDWGNIGSTCYGWSFWIRPQSTITKDSPVKTIISVNQTLIKGLFGSSTGLLFDETFCIHKSTAGDTRIGITENITNAWHLLTVSWDGSRYAIYLDGTLGTIITSGVVPLQTITTLQLGKIEATTPQDADLDEFRVFINSGRSANWIATTYETQDDPAGFMSWSIEESQATGSNVYYNDGTQNIEWQRDDASPVQKFNGAEIVGLKLGNTNDPNASPAHVFVGTAIKAILRMP